MKKPVAIVIASLVLGLLGLGGMSSCKQGEGERCQVQADCEDGFICNEAEGICRSLGAAVPFDATPDGPPDAPDAPIDAM